MPAFLFLHPELGRIISIYRIFVLPFDTLKYAKSAHTLCEGCMVENIFTEVVFTTGLTVGDTGGDLDAISNS